MADNEIVLITGQSGIGIKTCIKRLGYDSISLEEYMEQEKKVPFRRFIVQPQITQYETWTNTFCEIFDRKLMDNKKFFTFHAVYYHQAKRELYSSLNIEKVIKYLQKRVSKVIVFIDDIYDVYRRLLEKGKMYDYILSDEIEAKEAIYESIYNILSLLNWREMEISISRILAKILGADFYVISTLHPSFMLKRLFENRKEDIKIYYLSHPISEVRKMASKYLTSIVGTINNICTHLIHKIENLIIFYPTSIDEKIILKEQIKRRTCLIPHLGQRWELPFPRNQMLAPLLNEEMSKTEPLNPKNYKLRSGDKESISRCLELLDKFIHEKQIKSRDYSLIEQCKNGIIAVRPFFQGERSDGMIGELTHNFELIEKDNDRSCQILSCISDMDKYKIETFLRKFILNDPNISNYKARWIEDSYFIRKKFQKDLIYKLEKEILPKGFDYSKILTVDSWDGDHEGRKEIALERIFKSLRKEISKDELGSKIKEGDYQNRTEYRFFNENVFPNEAIKYLEGKIAKEKKNV